MSLLLNLNFIYICHQEEPEKGVATAKAIAETEEPDKVGDKFNPSSLIYLQSNKEFLTPVENAEEYAKKAIRLINAGPELPNQPLSKETKNSTTSKRKKERQRKFIPKPPSDTEITKNR